MNTINRLLVMLMLPAAGSVSEVSAEPFQLQVTASFAQFDSSFPTGGNVEGDVLSLSAVYYLQVVDTTNGPLAARPFLDKSAFIQGSITQTKPDLGQDVDTTDLHARFVTQDDMIFELGYSKADSGAGGDTDTLEFGVGKYLDRSTTAVLYFEKDDNSNNDVDTFGGRYRRVLDNSVASTFVAYEVGLAYVDTTSDSGFEISLGGTYYPSEQLSFGATFEYLDVGDFDESNILLSANNFFTDTLFAELAYNKSSDSNDNDIDFIGVQAGARF